MVLIRDVAGLVWTAVNRLGGTAVVRCRRFGVAHRYHAKCRLRFRPPGPATSASRRRKVIGLLVVAGIASLEQQCKIIPLRTCIAARPIGKFLMASSNDHDPLDAGTADLSGLCVLVVEDSWHIGIALKSLLCSLGADVDGPVATTAEAERLIAAQVPDAAIVDFNLRGGELAYELIEKLNEVGTRVILVTG